jgi:ferredoxin
VALDAVAAEIVGVDPEDIEMVRIAAGRGLGNISPQTIGNARGASLKIKKAPLSRLLPYAEDMWTSERLNRISHPLVKRLYGDEVISLKQARREMDEADPSRIRLAGPCSQCGLCVAACPMKTITLDGQPAFGEKCIKCFICVEICPDGALAIERK